MTVEQAAPKRLQEKILDPSNAFGLYLLDEIGVDDSGQMALEHLVNALLDELAKLIRKVARKRLRQACPALVDDVVNLISEPAFTDLRAGFDRIGADVAIHG